MSLDFLNVCSTLLFLILVNYSDKPFLLYYILYLQILNQFLISQFSFFQFSSLLRSLLAYFVFLCIYLLNHGSFFLLLVFLFSTFEAVFICSSVSVLAITCWSTPSTFSIADLILLSTPRSLVVGISQIFLMYLRTSFSLGSILCSILCLTLTIPAPLSSVFNTP